VFKKLFTDCSIKNFENISFRTPQSNVINNNSRYYTIAGLQPPSFNLAITPYSNDSDAGSWLEQQFCHQSIVRRVNTSVQLIPLK